MGMFDTILIATPDPGINIRDPEGVLSSRVTPERLSTVDPSIVAHLSHDDQGWLSLQSKDLDCDLDTYRIAGDGTWTRHQMEWGDATPSIVPFAAPITVHAYGHVITNIRLDVRPDGASRWVKTERWIDVTIHANDGRMTAMDIRGGDSHDMVATIRPGEGVRAAGVTWSRMVTDEERLHQQRMQIEMRDSSLRGWIESWQRMNRVAHRIRPLYRDMHPRDIRRASIATLMAYTKESRILGFLMPARMILSVPWNHATPREAAMAWMLEVTMDPASLATIPNRWHAWCDAHALRRADMDDLVDDMAWIIHQHGSIENHASVTRGHDHGVSEGDAGRSHDDAGRSHDDASSGADD
jgi:hypothetical protein